MARCIGVLALVMGSAGCYCSHLPGVEPEPRDAAPIDAAAIDAPEVRFEGCDDPGLWEVAALEAPASVEIGGDACEPAQYPAHAAHVGARLPHDHPSEERLRLSRSCWRVVAAHPESGWDVGRIVASDRPWLAVQVIGHQRPVTFEGRVIRDDGVVRVVVREAMVALDEASVLEGPTDVVAVGVTGETLARRRSVRLDGVDQPTVGDVVAATATTRSSLVWLERVGTELFLRVYRNRLAPEVHSTSLGSPADARLAPRGTVVVLDGHEVVIVQEDDLGVIHRVTFTEPIESIVAGWPAVVVHVGDALVSIDADGVERARLAVGAGTLLPGPHAHLHPPYFWDGARVAAVDAREALALDASRTIEPTPEERAVAGELLAVGHDVLIGREGFVHWPRYEEDAPGPRAVGARVLYGGPLTLVAADATSYVAARPDGSATLYRVPFVDWCD